MGKLFNLVVRSIFILNSIYVIFGDYEEHYCKYQAETGTCRGHIKRYYYYLETRRCVPFTWGGCGGNQNNFATKEDCEVKCMGLQIDPVPGVDYGDEEEGDPYKRGRRSRSRRSRRRRY